MKSKEPIDRRKRNPFIDGNSMPTRKPDITFTGWYEQKPRVGNTPQPYRKSSRWNKKENAGSTPLHDAAASGNLTAVKRLIEEGADFIAIADA